MESSCEIHASSLKRKQAAEAMPSPCKIARVGMECRNMFSSCAHTSHCCPMQSKLVDNCFKYLNSRVPCRIMFYNKGEWSDFLDSVRQALVDGFKKGNSCVKIMMRDHLLIIDFLSMSMVNLVTRKHCSIAWIDDADNCFFPNFFVDGGAEEFVKLASNATNGKLQEAMATPSFTPPLEIVKKVNVEKVGPVSKQRKVELVERDSETFLFVQFLFLSGMCPFVVPRNILIHRIVSEDIHSQIRLETFERQIRSTRAERGDANVRYGWFGTSKSEVTKILVSDFGNVVKPSEGAILGSGIYLTPEDRAFASVKHCEFDAKEVHYMLLCRIILGKMEIIKPGSKQNFPSSREYDSGVDDPSSPKCYVVWPNNVQTCIYPEYVVAFKLYPEVREYLFGLNDIRFNLKPTGIAEDLNAFRPVGCKLVKLQRPTSPWIPLAMLVAVVENKVSPIAKELIKHHYRDLRWNIITREEMIKKLRVLVGERLIISTLEKFKQFPSSWQAGSVPEAESNNPAEPFTLKLVFNDYIAVNIDAGASTLRLSYDHSMTGNLVLNDSSKTVPTSPTASGTTPNDSATLQLAYSNNDSPTIVSDVVAESKIDLNIVPKLQNNNSVALTVNSNDVTSSIIQV